MCHYVPPILFTIISVIEAKPEQQKTTYLNKLKGLIETNKDKVVVIGECGVDYGRLI